MKNYVQDVILMTQKSGGMIFQFKDPLNLRAPPGAHAQARVAERSAPAATEFQQIRTIASILRYILDFATAPGY